ncbi:hypothetical protein K9L63_03160 [Candidatus Gracilibacteria bacterium]|nr:hypothetical protein [Candidatus Gracilibacteria bacterium]
MKIILFTTYHSPAASTALKAFLQNTLRKKHDIDVVGIVAVSMLSPQKSILQTIIQFIKRSGWQFAFASFLVSFGQCVIVRFAKHFIPDKKRQYFEIKELADRYKIPYKETKNVRSPEVRSFLQQANADYFVSCLLYQLLPPSILSMPALGAINFHPALFQDHRGTFSSFWTLLRNRKKSGATVHFMTERFDEGKVILQRHFRVHRSDTIHCINQKSAKLGGNLLVKALVKLKKRKASLLWLKKAAKIFSMPGKKETEFFQKNGKHLIKWQDLFRI